jgi:polyisoprenoid-binding protein YceI
MPKHLLPIVSALLVAGVAHAQDAAPKFVQAPAGSSLVFGFDQAGAASEGSFRRFSTTFTYDEKNLAASSLAVTVQTASLDTQDADRDMTLKSADLLATDKFPTATYTARSLEKSAGGVQAVGQLTLRGVTKDLRIPLAIRPTAAGLELSGSTTIKRLDYGVGQNEWAATGQVANEVTIDLNVVAGRAK